MVAALAISRGPAIRVLVAAVALTGIACQGGDAPTPPRDPAVVGTTGGEVKSADGRVSVMVPPGALSADVRITIAKAADDPSDKVAAGTVHDFGPSGTQFAVPVELTIPYDSTILAAGVDPAALQLGRRLATGVWETLEGIIVDSAKRTVRGRTRNFSAYGVTVSPCNARSLPSVSNGTSAITRGALENSDCADRGVRRDSWTVSGSEAAEFELTSSIPHRVLVGSWLQVGNYSTTPTSALVDQTHFAGGTTLLRVATSRSPQIIVIGLDSLVRGEYMIRHVPMSGPQVGNGNGCSRAVYLEQNTSVNGVLDPNGDCAITIAFSPFPGINGKQSFADYYRVKAGQGQLDIIAAPSFQIDTTRYRATLAIFRNGQNVAVVSTSGTNAYRLDTGPPGTTGYFTVEVSNGVLWQNEWRTPATTYSVYARCVACAAPGAVTSERGGSGSP